MIHSSPHLGRHLHAMPINAFVARRPLFYEGSKPTNHEQIRRIFGRFMFELDGTVRGNNAVNSYQPSNSKLRVLWYPSPQHLHGVDGFCMDRDELCGVPPRRKPNNINGTSCCRAATPRTCRCDQFTFKFRAIFQKAGSTTFVGRGGTATGAWGSGEAPTGSTTDFGSY